MKGMMDYWFNSLRMALESVAWWPKHRYHLFAYCLSVATRAETKVLKLNDGSIIQSAAPGTPFQLFREIWHYKVYNPVGFEIRRDFNVVDVGAHIGGFTLWAARQTSGKVLAVEPLRSAFASLKETISTNHLSNVKAINAAVTKSAGTCLIQQIPGTNMGSVLPMEETAPECERHSVQCMTLGQLVEELNSVDFLKIDVEGAEFDIIDSIDSELARRIGKIAMEYHDWVEGKDHYWIADRLQQLGYETRIEEESREVGYIYAWKAKGPSI